MTSRGHNGTLSWLRLVLLLVAALSGPHVLLGQCSEENFVQNLPQVQAMEDDLVSECPKQCSCYHTTLPRHTGRRGMAASRRHASVLHVDCSQRGLLDFPPDIPTDAYSLDISGNRIVNITSLPRLASLRELDLANNWLRHIDNKWVFEHSPKLRVLRVSENRLKSIQHGSFSGLPQLEELDLSMNILTSLDTHALAGLQSLKILRLDRNQLYECSRDWFMSLTSLIELYASHNHIAKLESRVLDRLKHLQHLDLSQNALHSIHEDAFVGLDNLRLLNLSSNALLGTLPSKVFASSVLPGLDILLADNTNIQRLPPYAVANLSVTEISLSFMPRLRVIEKFAFFNCSRLLTLQIHDNPQLIFIHPSSFSSLPTLQRLLIHNNGLIAVPEQIVKSLPSLSDLQLHHNPIHCDCNSFWLRNELGRHQKHYHHARFGNYVVKQNNSASNAVVQTTSSSKPPVDGSTSPPAESSSQAAVVEPNSLVSITDPFIREPDRVACFFPDTQQVHSSSVPMVQIAISYFSPTCPPSILSLFPPIMNATLGDNLQLECQGLGVPVPKISWILPDGTEINSSSPIPNQNLPRLELRDETMLIIKNVHASDSGMYGCTAANSFGEEMSSVMVKVQNKPLDLVEAQVGYNYITVGLVGSIPRGELGYFQIYYRKSNREFASSYSSSSSSSEEGRGGVGGEGASHNDIQFDPKKAGYKVMRLKPHGNFHTAMINNLKPHTPYEVCLVYKDSHRVSCKLWTTLNVLRVVQSPRGIVRISKTQVVVAIVGGVLAVVILLVVVALIKRRGKTNNGYHNSVASQDEKASIPLDGMLSSNVNPSLNSSRTALLSNSHV